MYAEQIIRNAGLDDLQAGIKIGGRNINNLKYVDDTTLMAESEEELKSLLKVKEESERASLRLNIKKKKKETFQASFNSPFTLNKRLFSSSSLSAIRVVSSVYLRLLIFLLAILIPACDSSNLAFHMIYSAYKLNKQGDNMQLYVLLSQF